MPAQLATVLCVLCIAGLVWLDGKRPQGVSRAVWVPAVWMFLAGSRFVSQWLNLAPPAGALEGEGSPLDRNVFLGLICAAAWILSSRNAGLQFLAKRNPWLLAFYVLAGVSATWADDPALAFKRWVKGLGNLLMALVIVSEKRADEAVGFVLRCLAIVLLPLSVLFIKYYPELGRGYFMGEPMFSGATLTKNALGQLCMVSALYLLWEVLFPGRSVRPQRRRVHPISLAALGVMTGWLLYMANSVTSVISFATAGVLLISGTFSRFRGRPGRVLWLAAASSALLVVVELTLGVKDSIITSLGRRPDLTDRDEIWRIVLSFETSPLFGVGYESFWTGDRARQIWSQLGVEGINQAHNGYIELYLNLGLIGLFLLLAGVVRGLARAVKDGAANYPYTMLRLALIIASLVYNFTEAMFISVSNIFVLLLVASLGEGSRGQSVAAPFRRTSLTKAP